MTTIKHKGGIHVLVKSFTWCSVTVVAVLAAALLFTAPASAHSDDNYQHNYSHETDSDDIQDPQLYVETGACVEQGALEGTIGVDITNPNDHKMTYKVTVNGEEKSVTVKAHATEYIAFTELAIGDYAVDVAGPHGTSAAGSATIKQCHTHERPVIDVNASCGCGEIDSRGRLDVSITNTNDYDVTYTVRVGGQRKDVFVEAHSSASVRFNGLSAGDYEISVSGDDCTRTCVTATVEDCPAEEPQPEQPGQGGGTPTPEEPAAPVTPEVPTAPAPVTTAPATLPNTSATTPVATPASVQTHSINLGSLILVAIGAPILAVAVLRRKNV